MNLFNSAKNSSIGFKSGWMVRMLLKPYSPVHIPEKPAMQQFHFLLPSLLDFQNSFEAAMKILQGDPMNQMPARVAKEDEIQLREIAIGRLVPHIGVMITRPAHEKARGIKDCCQLAGWRRMSVERKYHGEYCQVHIDLGNL
jgi:DNA ligase-4